MNRRKFIKRGALWTAAPMLFLPRAKAQFLPILSGSVAASGFTPPAVYPLWLKADDGPNDPVDGQPVSTWADKSGTGHDATALLTTRPLYKTNIINGLPVVRFDGTDDLMLTSSIDLSGTSAATLFVVFSATSGASEMVVDRINNVTDNGFRMFRRSDDAVEVKLVGDVGASSQFSDPATVTTTAKICVGVFDKSAASGSEVSLEVNGDTSASTSSSSENTDSFSNAVLTIGARSALEGGPDLYLNGDIAEILLFSSALSSGDKTLVRNYLKTKYGISF